MSREIIHQLEELEIKFNEHDRSIIWESTEGKQIIAWALKKVPAVAVADSFLPKGVEFPIHKHEEAEVLICYEGRADCIVRCDEAGEVVIPLVPGRHVSILPRVPHCIKTKEDTRFIAVTVPASEGFPDE